MADNTILYGKWYFNETINAQGCPDTNIDFSYAYNETINNYTRMRYYNTGLVYEANGVTWVTSGNSWTAEHYRTIVITNGGSDNFLTWLQANATKVSDSIDDLKTNKMIYTEQMNELTDIINDKASVSGSKSLSELVKVAKAIIKPSGTINISVGGEHNVKEFEKANVIFPSGDSEVRSLKKWLDVKKDCGDMFSGTSIVNANEFLEFSDTSSVTNMSYMFQNCSSLTEVPLLDTSNVTKMAGIFYACEKLLEVPLFDTSKVTTLSSAFISCKSLKTIPLFDTSSNTSIWQMFSGCSSLTEVPLFDTSKITQFDGLFTNCSSLTIVPLFDTSNVTKFSSVFSGCSSLTTVPLFNTSSVTNMSNLFTNCSSLTTVPLFNTSSVTNMYGMFSGCSSLTEVPLFDTSKVTSFNEMFKNCKLLTTIQGLDIRSLTSSSSGSNMFQYCTVLTNLTISNIKVNLTIGSGSTYGHLLTLESLLNACQECINVSANRTLTVGSENITKLSEVYVKLTGEAEVDETLPKLPMVQCESTDEGAMLVADYMALKNWSLA